MITRHTAPQPQPQQEPVAEIQVINGYWIDTPFSKTANLSNGIHKLYTTPQPQPQQTPIAFEFYNPKTGHAIVDYGEHTYVGKLTADKGYIAKPLYASPPQPQPQQEPVAFLVEGFGDEGLISHQLFFKAEDAKRLASVFLKHYPTVRTTALIRIQSQNQPLTKAFLQKAKQETECVFQYNPIASEAVEYFYATLSVSLEEIGGAA